MRRTTKLLGAGMLAAAAYAVWRAVESRRTDSSVTWEPQPFPYPPVPRRPEATDEPTSTSTSAESTEGTPDRAWIEPDGSAACPATHPVKAKLSSGIYHLPGGANYERTRPDRCYASTAAAEADGLRAAKV